VYNNEYTISYQAVSIIIGSSQEQTMEYRFFIARNLRESLTGIFVSIIKKALRFQNLISGRKMIMRSIPNIGSIFSFGTHSDAKHTHNKSGIQVDKQVTDLNWEGKTALIVEDNFANYILLKSMLAKTKIKILHCDNGVEAVNLCQSRPEIDLVLMDIQLPRMNGYDATKKIKSFNPELPVIAQTAYALRGDEFKSFDAGCNEHLSKPVNRELLISTLRKYLINL